ncbi:translation initiation factor IF-3, mitochondrial [Dendroctonus ponderosae]|uniref:Translation initiation factor 3 N-terminal domain-containing protein n=1 Tax=Dendroctonus ponderosae TaxID=77166 RepID=U4TU79_DENPD|nr:translation initiation factor IF-3, mitochondrial [Dendroctonus ponderosae]ERL85114.1 hypothetical protein D910_02536 [Dendroctonus ponderosae]KAH1026521.1 hypothetical protein HUJ05_000181 [Dendroctonus ponderosae]
MFRRTCLQLRALSQSYLTSHQEINIRSLPAACLFSNSAYISPNEPLPDKPSATEAPKKKKTAPIPRITLLNGADISISTLEDAQKIAKRRDLKLIKLLDLDTKTDRPVYRLMTGAEYHHEDLKQRETKKAIKAKGAFKKEKLLIMSQNITEHDLQTNINKLLKWISRRYEVRIVINGNSENSTKSENVFATIQKSVTDQGRIVQKRQKGSDIKFQILPPKEPKQTDDSDQNNDDKAEPPP